MGRPGAQAALRGRRLGTAGARSGPCGRRPGAIAVEAVVAPGGLQTGGQDQRLARVGVAAEQLQRAAEAELGEVVRRGPLDHCLELASRLLVALSVEQGATERLADRCLVGSEVARPGEGNHRLVVMARLEQLSPAPVQLIHVVHDSILGRTATRSESRGRATAAAPTARADARWRPGPRTAASAARAAGPE